MDAEFALIDLTTGQLRDPLAGAQRLRGLGQQLQTWSGRIYEKLSSYLVNLADDLFRYHPVLTQALTPLVAQWGAPGRPCCAKIWQLEADAKRHPRPWPERQARQRAWEKHLDEASAHWSLRIWATRGTP